MLGLGIVPAHAKTIIAYPGNNAIYFAVEASAPGDSVLVMPGVYPYEIGVDIHHSLTIVGVGGASRNSVEICSDLCLTYLFGIYSDANSAVSIEGLNITRSNLYPGTVRGILLTTPAYTTITDCVFHDLQDRAIIVFGSGSVPPRIEGNLFYGNQTGIDFRSGTGRVEGNTFVATGVGILLDGGASPVVANNVFASSLRGILCFASNPAPKPEFICNDAWNISMGSYSGCEDPTGTDGNLSADPLFCDPEGDFRLLPKSPCLPENAPAGCGLIGAYGGCMATAVEEVATPPASELMTIESNPASHEAAFTLHASGALLSFEIYAASGRLLARLHPDSGRIRWTPDGAVRRGVYFARAVTAESSQVVKFVIVR
jgi:hypothetical protein